MKLERLDHFGIEVGNLARAERFYIEVLGLSVVAHLGDQVLLDCGGQNLALFGVARESMTPAERQKYREETHAKMLERAKYLLISELATVRNTSEQAVEVNIVRALAKAKLQMPEAAPPMPE